MSAVSKPRLHNKFKILKAVDLPDRGNPNNAIYGAVSNRSTTQVLKTKCASRYPDSSSISRHWVIIERIDFMSEREESYGLLPRGSRTCLMTWFVRGMGT